MSDHKLAMHTAYRYTMIYLSNEKPSLHKRGSELMLLALVPHTLHLGYGQYGQLHCEGQNVILPQDKKLQIPRLLFSKVTNLLLNEIFFSSQPVKSAAARNCGHQLSKLSVCLKRARISCKFFSFSWSNERRCQLELGFGPGKMAHLSRSC